MLTLANILAGQLNFITGLFYITVQCLGSIVGALCIFQIFNISQDQKEHTDFFNI